MILREIPGVEYVYSTSSPGSSLIIVSFYVGTRQEDALVKVYSKLYANLDHIPPGVSPSIVKSRSIDDVPILALTLWSRNYDAYHLRQIAAELEHSIKQVDDVSETRILGGQPRSLRVNLSISKLASYSLSPSAVVAALQTANAKVEAGEFSNQNQQIRVEAGSLFTHKEDVEQVVLGVSHGRPVLLGNVADQIVDGPNDPTSYVNFGVGQGALRTDPHAQVGAEFPAVTITVAKRKGTNATDIANHVLARIAELKGTALPADLTITTTRNYGETAKAKSDELLKHLLLATLSVTLLIAIFLGWRESGVVLLAIPVTLALTLGIFYLLGYTLNRVTLFALIFSIGILVDDAIIVVENIVRHFRLPENKGRPLSEVAIESVAEVGNPTILATFAVIAAILPMASVHGLMGPYMMPIPIGASSAMMFSLLVAGSAPLSCRLSSWRPFRSPSSESCPLTL
jgi:multidrug efflux pump subunit AcrB